MPSHPLFDETVVERLRNVTDVLVAFIPASIAAVNLILRPGPADDPAAATVNITFPDAPPPANWTTPEPVTQAARDLASAWLSTGHAMPAFQFTHRRNETGLWQASTEPLQDW